MSETKPQAAIDSVLREERVFPPPDEFSRHAHVPDRTRYDALYRWSVDDPEGFWREMAGRLRWMAPFKRVLDWQPPFAKWFVGGRLNIADNCLDRHLSGPRRNKAALVWEGDPVPMAAGRDRWWHELVDAASADCPAVPLDSEHPLFILYTSGTTGKPKGVVHTTGGYLLHAAVSCEWVFDLKDQDTFWCTADIGWVTGHTYVVYGPRARGPTSVIH